MALHYLVLAANAEPEAPDPIVVLGGGRGRTAFTDLLVLAALQREGTDRAIVVLERRGAGYSRPSLGCPAGPGLPGAIECRDALDRAAVRVEDFGTDAAARDAIALLDLLGVERANLVAIDAGARWARRVAELAPHRVRSLVFDSLYFGPVPGSADRVLAALVDACGRDPGCRSAFPSLAERLDVVIAARRLPRATPDLATFVEMTDAALTDQAKLARIPAGIAAAARDDWVTAARLLQQGADIPEGVRMDRLMTEGLRLVECGEWLATSGEVGSTVRWPELERERARRLDADRDRCRVFAGRRGDGNPEAPAADRDSVGAIPSVALVGEFDPDARPVQATYGGPGAVVVPSMSRLTLGSACCRDVLRVFLARPAATPDPPCLGFTQPVHFVPR